MEYFKTNEINTKSELFIIVIFKKQALKKEFYNDTSLPQLNSCSSYPQANIAIATYYLESPNHI